jgi:hypothetical protein
MEFIEYLSKLNWPTIIGMFAIGWYFTKEIRETLLKLENDVREQGKRTDKLYEMYAQTQKEIANVRQDMYENIKKIDQKFYDLLKEQKK